jgi:hypothetical protein
LSVESDFGLKITDMEPDIDRRLFKVTPTVIEVSHYNYNNKNNIRWYLI